ncbi:MAG: hypothetical protein OXF00_04195, partial [bacterium]|nr:hypothetical protein [bacterium]
VPLVASTHGMAKTTIRVDTETRDRLALMGREAGATIGETVREAAEALWRMRFARESMQQLEALRQDPGAWADYLAEAESTFVADGVG